MRTLAIDLGDKRIGLAVSDPLGMTAQGMDTLECGGEDVIARLKKIISDYSVGEIVVGLPLNMNGQEGERAKAAAAFAQNLKNETGLPVKLWDERLTSVEAERVMLEADISRIKRKKASDKLSAQIILQGYLNSKKA